MNWDARIQQMQQAWQEEKQAEQQRFATNMREKSIKDRRDEGITLFPCSTFNSGFAAGNLVYINVKTDENVFHSKFSGGAAVQLTDGDNKTSGVINLIEKHNIRIFLNDREAPDWIFGATYEVNLIPDFRTYELGEKTMLKLLDIKDGLAKHLKHLLTGDQKAKPSSGLNFKINPSGLNDSQVQAAQEVVNGSGVTIIHGPPGTGKTKTLVTAISQWLSSRPEVGPILACTSSNAAIDHLCVGLMEQGVNVVRIGHPGRVDLKSSSCSVDAKIQGDKDFALISQWRKMGDELRTMARKHKRSFGHAERQQRRLLLEESKKLRRDSVELEENLKSTVVAGAQVIATTLTGAANTLIYHHHFQVCFIDEASQALEPLNWIPILKSDRLIIAGDIHQLAPTVLSATATQKGLNQTLMESLIKKGHPSHLLKVQYRMAPSIANFSNNWFYSGQLEHANPEAVSLDAFSAIEFIDTAGCDMPEQFIPETRSRFNQGEWNILNKRIAELLKSGYQDLAIISPYRGQVQWIQNELSQGELAEHRIPINSIDSYQGQEADVILLSLVRSNDKGEIGFLSDHRRMNVALTRAKRKLIVIGDSATIGNDKFFAQLLEYFETNGSYRSAWEWMYE